VLLTKVGLNDITTSGPLALLTASPALADDGNGGAEAPQFVPQRQQLLGYATHYGTQYNGQPLGCGAGLYSSADPSIIAIAPANYRDWGCGAIMRVCGSNGCIVGIREDSCPGCTTNVVDLSEAGIDLVCGPGASSCPVTIESGRMGSQ
jgi:hypothetical protein